jgi:hypothetical protein
MSRTMGSNTEYRLILGKFWYVPEFAEGVADLQ